MIPTECNEGFTVWFTGLPCAGKSTLALLVAHEMRRRGHSVEVLDADVVRSRLCSDLGYSKRDRNENIRRIGYLCEMLNRHGIVAVVAAISPYREVRLEVRARVGSFIEVYVKAPLEVCIKRDVKGMYRRALTGEIKDFTGIDDPYEAPLDAEVVVVTDKETPAESLAHIVQKLEQMGFVQSNGKPL